MDDAVALHDPCRACRAPLAEDQRYCLQCGEPAGPPRVDWRALCVARPAPSTFTAPGPAPVPRSLGALLPSPRVAAAAVLAVLGFGVLMGGALGPEVRAGVTAPRGALTLRLAAPSTPAEVAAVRATPVPAPTPAPVPDDPVPATPAPAPADSPVPAETAPAPETEPEPQADEPPPTGEEEATPEVPGIGHVFVISLGPNAFDALFGPQAASSYLARALTEEGTLLANYSAVSGGELANQIALISGQRPTPQTAVNCPMHEPMTPGTVGEDGLAQGEGCVYSPEVFTLPDQLVAAGLSWRAYVEGQDSPAAPGGPPQATCRQPAVGQPDPWQYPRPEDPYVPWRNPFVYFQTITSTPTCAADVVGLTSLAADLRVPAATAPAFTWIAPSPCHDGRVTPCAPDAPAGPAVLDAWLGQWVPRILASPAYRKDGLVAVVPDASGQEDLRTGALLLSHRLRAGRTVKTPYDHLSLLKSLGDLFGLRHLGAAGSETVQAFGRDVYGVTRTSR